MVIFIVSVGPDIGDLSELKKTFIIKTLQLRFHGNFNKR